MQMRRSFLVLTLAVIILFILASPASSTAVAAGLWYVAPEGIDSNNCASPTTPCASIKAAIGKAKDGDTIRIAVGTYTDPSENFVVHIDKNLDLTGGWDSSFTVQRGLSTIDGQHIHAGLLVDYYATATITRMKIMNGYTPFVGELGAGISSFGNLTINESQISNNTAGSQTSNVSGGGIHNRNQTMIINKSSISDNRLEGPWVKNGGIENYGPLYINNSTISGNMGDALYSGSNVSLNNVTISDNEGAGIISQDGVVSIRNSIVFGNDTAHAGHSDCELIAGYSGSVESRGFNLFGTLNGCAFAGTDRIGTDPRMLPLVGEPGFHPLQPSSPAINTGNPGGCLDGSDHPIVVDQRGIPRDSLCDVGAYEVTAVFLPYLRR